MSSCRHVGKYYMYGGFNFRIGCLDERKKNMRLARFSLHFARNRMAPCVANVHGNHYTSTYFILSRLCDRLILRNSLRGWYFRKKNPSACHSTLLRIALRVSTCKIHVLNRGLKVNIWSVINNELSHLGGYIYTQ